MSAPLSSNTQAILLLTAPLIVGHATASSDPLTPGEYKALARRLREIHCQPADLVSADAQRVLDQCHAVLDQDRLQRLLGRGFLLGQALQHWGTRAIWVFSRADPDYPRRLKARLREDAPALLYGCGPLQNLEHGGLAVVGSRKVDDSVIDYTASIGRLAAESGRAVVSGGARGVDQAAVRGALDAGGRACGVLADGLEKASMAREHRAALLEGRLTLVTPYDPSAGFNVGHAMQRNKLIYALADVALVVSSDLDKGGTWTGAVEQLGRFKHVPVFVRRSGGSSAGLDALQDKGAGAWPEPADRAALDTVFNAALPPRGTHLPLTQVAEAPAAYAAPPQDTPGELLFRGVRAAIVQLIRSPMDESDVAAALDVSATQAKAWLERLVEEDVLERQPPGRYAPKPSPSSS